ncbi:MAG: FAD binding domain-containing protein [Solirubrobacteraceae bacterium]
MEVFRPTALGEALEARAAHPDALAIAGGTDVMVELNFDKARPPAILDLTAVPELAQIERENGAIRIGAGVPYTRVIEELQDVLPALAQASRTVGSPQIRNRGTIGGNLGTASPAGDAHPPLLAAAATVEVASARAKRSIAVDAFFEGPGRSTLQPDELVTAVTVPTAGAREQFAKIGTRNAMVIAVCSFAVRVDRERSRVGTGIGSAGPTPLRAFEAEAFLTGVIEADEPIDEVVRKRFGELVSQAARPIDDHRGTADYRRHALGVLATRTLAWACA